MIDTTGIGYGLYIAAKTNNEYIIGKIEKSIAEGREEAVRLGIADIYDELISVEKACIESSKNGKKFDDEVLALQRKRLLLEQQVKLRSMGIGGQE